MLRIACLLVLALFTCGLPAQLFSNNTVQAIPDGPASGLINDIRVTGITTGTPLTFRVTVDITHTAAGDLHLYLVPAGLQWPGLEANLAGAAMAKSNGIVELSTGNGGTGDHYSNTHFVFKGDNNYDLAASAPAITTGSAPFAGTFTAEDGGFLSAISTPNGFWRLVVFDANAGETGTLNYWTLEISTSAGPEVTVDDDGRNFGRRYGIANGSTFTLPMAPAAGAAFQQSWFLSNLGDAQLTYFGAQIISVGATSNCAAAITTQPFSHFPSPLLAHIGGGGASFVWSCTPAAAGTFSFELLISSDDPNEPAFSFTIAGAASGAPGPEINIERPFGLNNTRHDGGDDHFAPTFATVAQNLSYTIRNHGIATLALSGGPNFVSIGTQVNCAAAVTVQPPAAGTVAPGANVSFTIAVTPAAPGVWFFVWTLDSNDPDEATFDLTVRGFANTGGQPEVHVRSGADVPDGGTDVVVALPNSVISRSYAVHNQGNASLTFSGSPIVSISGLVNCNAVVTSQPTGPVSFGTSTAFVVSITPSAIGAWSFQWAFNCNDPDEAVYNATVSGEALPVPECDISRAAAIPDGGTDVMTGGVAGVPLVLTYTIANNGQAGSVLRVIAPVLPPAQLAACTAVITTQPAAFVAAGSSTTLVVTVTPQNPGIFQFTIFVDSNDANEARYNWLADGVASATGTPECDVSRVAAVSDSGTDNVAPATAGSATTLTYTIANTGTVALAVSTTVTLGPTFTNCSVFLIAPPAASVPAGSSTTLVLSLTPTAAGAFSFNVSFANSDANENPYNWTVSGNAAPVPAPEIEVSRAAAPIAVATTDALGSVMAGAAQSVVYDIANSGNATLNLTGSPALVVLAPVSNIAALNLAVSPTATVAASGTTTFTISFTAAAPGAFSFTVSIANDDANENPYDWTVSGTATAPPAPELDVARTIAVPDGGSDTVASASAQTAASLVYTLSNSGAAQLDITGAAVVSNAVNCTVLITQQPAAAVAPGLSTTLAISVTPIAAGAFSFEVSVPNNDANENPYDWTVVGTAAPASSSGGGGGPTRSTGGGCTTGAEHAGHDWALALMAALAVALGLRRRHATGR